jgi:hypothetical protein
MSTRLRDLLMAELGELRSLGDDTVVDTTRAMLAWEPRRVVPTYAVPEADVAAEPARGGQAPYLSAPGEPDVAWYHPAPLREAAEVTDRIAFFNERVDVVLDGRRLERPVTPWSPG